MNWEKKFKQIKARYDARSKEKGHWVTTEDGDHIFVSQDGVLLKGNIFVLNAIRSTKIPQLILPKKEYGKVTRATNTVFHMRFKDRVGFTCGMFEGDYCYIFKNYGYNQYIITHKLAIERDHDIIEELEKVWSK